MLNAIFFYRIGNFCYRFKIPFIPTLMKGIIRIIYNSVLDCRTTIGKGTFLAYGGIGVVIHKKAIIGKNVNIGQQVTIGGRSNISQLPIIGDNVFIGAGAKILGDVIIGDNVVIGANSVVISNAPENSVLAGVPARILKINSK